MAPQPPSYGPERLPHSRPGEPILESAASGSGLAGTYSFGLDSSRIASGLASLKGALCQTCLGRCDGHDDYEPISEPPTYDYEPQRPYAVEKPPALDGVTSGPYQVSMTKVSGVPSFLDDGVPSSRYMPGFPSLQPGSMAAVTQPSSREQISYTAHPVAEYYCHEPQIGRSLALETDVQRSSAFIQEDVLSAGSAVGSFGDAEQFQQETMPGSSASRFDVVPTYGESGPVVNPHNSERAMMQHNVSYEVALTNQMHRPAARRGPFKSNDDREKTAQTRKIGSCVRCRMQRIRCLMNPADPSGSCLTCQKVTSNTKIRRLPCLRYKITDVKLFKPGQVRGYEWTRRWRDSIVDNISNWASDDIKIIHVSEGYTNRSVELRVRRFIPQEGDKLERSWVAPNGVKKSVAIPPYAIVDLDAAKKAYAEHIDLGIMECFSAIVKPATFLWRAYMLAWKMASDESVSKEERELLLLALRLWVSVRLTTKSTIIVGEETLGMPRDIMDETSPIHGCIPLPPVMGAQLDLILIHQIQSGLRRDLLDKLQKMIQTNKQKTWLTSYLVTFILLHNIAMITDHDASYARKHGMRRRYAREENVKEYHMGANILLAYFHYCNKGIYPFSNECKEQDLRTLAELDDAKLDFVKETRLLARHRKLEWDQLQRDGEYENSHFFVSQLFLENWEPRSTV